MDVDETIRLLEGTKWKFFERTEDHNRVEIPRAYDLTLVIELPPSKDVEKKLKANDFIKSETRVIPP